MPRTDTGSGTEDSGGRKLRQLADGRISRGYLSMEVEAVEAPISAEALGLLTRMRHDSGQRERDGDVDGLALDALAVYCRLPKGRLPKLLAELEDAGLVEQLPAGARDLNFSVWGKTRGEREDMRERWRVRQRRARQRDDGGDDNNGVTPMSRRDNRVSHAGITPSVTPMSPTVEVKVEVEVEREGEVVTPPVAPPRGPADGLSTERPDVRAYGERFIHHGRTPSGEDIEFLRRVPYEFGRLAQSVVLAAIDDVAAKHLAQGKPMPKAKYLAGKLGDLQTAAADSGVLPRESAGRSGGLTRLADLLPGGAM